MNKNKLSKFELASILGICRSVPIACNQDKNDLLTLIYPILDSDKNFIEYWNNLIESFTIKEFSQTIFAEYSYLDCLNYLENKNMVTFPIPLSYITKNKKETILSYFYMIQKSMEIPRRIYNFEQQMVINKRGLIIVNAGPGTGKTTTACKKAFLLKDEGVIFLSYTNAAVFEDRNRMYEYPGCSSNMSFKSLDKKLAFLTVDSLAGNINGGISSTFDHSIRDAISKVEKRNITTKQRHIIVDEAQDIDDLRAELILALFLTGRFLSLTIFGDPRQRIKENSGKWYYDMWTQVNPNISKIGFIKSHRFKDIKILNLVNDLSRRRPEIHCELQVDGLSNSNNINSFIDNFNTLNTEDDKKLEISNNKAINIYNANNNPNVIEKIANFIKRLNNRGISYSEFMVVGPSLEADNKSSNFSKEISSIFRNQGIPCRISSEGSYQRDGVLFSTIHSIKGKEADYVFIFSINDYPNTFSMIPYEQAESLIYVSHSRARKKIFYILKTNTVNLPRGILLSHVHSSKGTIIKTSSQEDEPEFIYKSVTSLSKCFDFNKLLETNRCILEKKLLDVSFPKMIQDSGPSDFFGILIGVSIQIFSENCLPSVITKFLENDYRIVSDNVYNQIKNKNVFLNGQLHDGELIIKNSFTFEILRIKELEISELTVSDLYLITTIFIFLTSGFNYEYNGEYNNELINYSKNVSKIIEDNFGKVIGTEFRVFNYKIIGSIDLLTENYIIELKTKREINPSDMLQVFIYRSLEEKHYAKTAILINLRRNETFEILSNRDCYYWNYIIDKYVELKDNVDIIKFKCGKERKDNTFQNNTFCVDTEFYPQTSTIFEISILNINDPFRSIIQTVNMNEIDFACKWLKLSSDIFKSSPYIKDIIDIFKDLIVIYNQKPILYYYCCKVDVSWSNFESYDVSNSLKKVCLKSGIFNGFKSVPKLKDYYNNHIDFLEHRQSLSHHTALSDTIMLYEILKLL